jgi:very-short-patch-repair endonuclease
MNESSGRARALRRSQTAAEARLWRALRNRGLNGFKFRRQWPIDRFVADFACLAAGLVVEVDGATHGTAAEQARDTARSASLARCGFEVLRLANHDVMQNLAGVRETILAAIERRITL